MSFVDKDIWSFARISLRSVERQFEVRDLALARLEGEKERGGEVQVSKTFCQNSSGEIILRDILVIFMLAETMVMLRRGCEKG